MGIVLAILLFSLIIIIHELGHFSLAKANKIRVDEFSLGLGPTLFGKVIGGTKFSLKLLPFGGACMMGEDDADDMSEGSFNSKSVWARMSVIAARAAVQSDSRMAALCDHGRVDRICCSGHNRGKRRICGKGTGNPKRGRDHGSERRKGASLG